MGSSISRPKIGPTSNTQVPNFPLSVTCDAFELPILINKIRKNRKVDSAVIEIDTSVHASADNSASKTRKSALAKLAASKKAHETATKRYLKGKKESENKLPRVTPLLLANQSIRTNSLKSSKDQQNSITCGPSFEHTDSTCSSFELVTTPSSEIDDPFNTLPVKMDDQSLKVKVSADDFPDFSTFGKEDGHDSFGKAGASFALSNEGGKRLIPKDIAPAPDFVCRLSRVPVIQVTSHETPYEDSYEHAMSNPISPVFDFHTESRNAKGVPYATQPTSAQNVVSTITSGHLASPHPAHQQIPSTLMPESAYRYNHLKNDSERTLGRRTTNKRTTSKRKPSRLDLLARKSATAAPKIHLLHNVVLSYTPDLVPTTKGGSIESVYNFYADMTDEELSTRLSPLPPPTISIARLPDTDLHESTIPTPVSDTSNDLLTPYVACDPCWCLQPLSTKYAFLPRFTPQDEEVLL